MRCAETVLLLIATGVGIGTRDPWMMLVVLVLGYLTFGLFRLFSSGD